MTDVFYYRTEDIRPDEIRNYYVPTAQDEEIVSTLRSANPTILQGSRGTGKSFLLRVAELQALDNFDTDRVLPVYMSFVRSSLIHTTDPDQFRNWMLARICSRMLRAITRQGLIARESSLVNTLAGGSAPAITVASSQMDAVIDAYEQSYRNPDQPVDTTSIPTIESLRDLFEDLCEELQIRRFLLLFDEAAHIFRPEQQRQFFTLFRDLRSPFVTCNAAVYPGVTSYGPTFQPAHDATFVKIDRNVLDTNYVDSMREIVEKQAQSNLMTNIEKRRKNFAILAYAVSGNPRLLLKTVARAASMREREVSDTIKSFYRSDIWAEHSALGETYKGHEPLIAWGRSFIEDQVLHATKVKNDQRRDEERDESTAYFWIHNDAPEPVKEAIQLLEYSGIVNRGDEWVRTTRGETGTRFAVNLGCLFGLEANPASTAFEIGKHLTPRRFTEYGANHSSYESLQFDPMSVAEPDAQAILRSQLVRSIGVLDITEFQADKLRELDMTTVGQVLEADEMKLQEAYLIGPVRSRQMMNAAHASVLEYLSG